MDKFIYRAIFQTLIKGALAICLTSIGAILIFSIFDIAWYQILLSTRSAEVDFWVYLISFGVCGIIVSLILQLSDNIPAKNLSAQSAGKRWYNNMKHGVKTDWKKLNKAILPLLFLAIICLIVVIAFGKSVLNAFITHYAVTDSSELGDAVTNNFWYFASITLTPFFVIQWLHVKEFLELSKCDKCGCAFSLINGDYSTISKKDSVDYVIRTEKEEIGAMQVDGGKWVPIYDSNNVKYRIDTETTTCTSYYVCAHCGTKQSRDNSFITKQTETRL